MRNSARTQADEDQGPDAIELGLDIGIRPHGDMERIVKEPGCSEHSTSGNEGIISGKLALSNSITNDPGDLLNEEIEMRPDNLPCCAAKLFVRRK